MTEILTKLAGRLAEAVAKAIGEEMGQGIAREQLRDAFQGCVVKGLEEMLDSLKLTDQPAERYDFLAAAVEDPPLAKRVADFFHRERMDPNFLRELCERHGLESGHSPEDWDLAAEGFRNRFMKAASRDERLNPLFAAAQRLRHTEPGPVDPLAPPRERYLQKLVGEMRILPLITLADEVSDKAAPTLDEVMVPLNTETEKEPAARQISGPNIGAQLQQPSDEEKLSAWEAFHRQPRMVLLGDPGSGKSTFAKDLVALSAEIARRKQDATEVLTAELLPVYLVLRDLVEPLAAVRGDLPPASNPARRAQLHDILCAEIRRCVATLEKDFAELPGEDFDQMLIVLDGLDEVPFALRSLVREAVNALLLRHQLKRVLITCRVRSYDEKNPFPDFAVHRLAPLDDNQIGDFTAKWYCAQAGKQRISRTAADQRTALLQEAALNMRELAENPLMLTTMAIIHLNRKELPDQRVVLYREIVLLLLKKWKEAPKGKEFAPVLQDFLKDEYRLLSAMQRLAYEAHAAGRKGTEADLQTDLARERAVALLAEKGLLGKDGLAADFIDHIDQHTGLLIGRGGELDRPASYSFPHRTFQEYLAGCHFTPADPIEAAENILRLAEEGDYWAVAVELGAEELRHNMSTSGVRLCLNLARELFRTKADKLLNQRANLWAARVAAKASLPELEAVTSGVMPGPSFVKQLRRKLAQSLGGRKLPARERAEAGRILNHFGDPRLEVMQVDRMEFCFVPRGPFYENVAKDPVELDYDYWLGRFPVTNAQFAEFVAADGYGRKEFWPEATAADFWNLSGFKGRWDNERRTGPAAVPEPFGLPNHPVVNVSWYEMLAFTRWLNVKFGQKLPAGLKFQLPDQKEWVKAARGGRQVPRKPFTRSINEIREPACELIENPNPQRSYPWGASLKRDQITPELANCKESELGATSAVGGFNQAASPYGCEEMAGNVWEWSRSANESEFRENTWLWYYGGAYWSEKGGVGCSARGWDYPDLRSNLLGFRVSLSPFSGPLVSVSSDL